MAKKAAGFLTTAFSRMEGKQLQGPHQTTLIFLTQEEPWRETELMRQFREVISDSVSLFFFLRHPCWEGFGFRFHGHKVAAPPPGDECALQTPRKGQSEGSKQVAVGSASFSHFPYPQ